MDLRSLPPNLTRFEPRSRAFSSSEHNRSVPVVRVAITLRDKALLEGDSLQRTFTTSFDDEFHKPTKRLKLEGSEYKSSMHDRLQTSTLGGVSQKVLEGRRGLDREL